METKEIPLTHPRQYCKHAAKDGRVCSLYLDHHGLHKENHGHSYWDDNE